MQALKLKRSEVPGPWLAAFPSYKGRTFRVELRDSVAMDNGYWSGGSKSSYAAVDLATGKASSAHEALRSPACYGGFNPGSVPIPVGIVVAEHVWFCGKDLGVRFYVNPETLKHKQILAHIPSCLCGSAGKLALLGPKE